MKPDKSLSEVEKLKERYTDLYDFAPVGYFTLARNGMITQTNLTGARLLGMERARLSGLRFAAFVTQADLPVFNAFLSRPLYPQSAQTCELGLVRENQSPLIVQIDAALSADGQEIRVVVTDITERKRRQASLDQRQLAMTRPLVSTEDIKFQDLFNLDEIQKIQDAFALATGVASVITDPEGRPLTRPSNFCNLCQNVIRKTEKGLQNCFHSDAVLGQMNPGGPLIQPCLSGGLWDGGAGILAGDRQIANWLVGQVLDDAVDQESMLDYAREIGANESEFRQALAEVTHMPKEQFARICQALFLIAELLSRLALQNVQQARHITAGKEIEQKIQRYTEQLATVGEMGRLLASSLNQKDIYKQLGYAILQLLPDIVTIFISRFDPQQDLITAVYALQDGIPFDVSDLPTIKLLPLGQGTQSDVIRTGRPMIVADLRKKLKNKRAVNIGTGGTYTHSAVYVPLAAQDQILGVMQVQSLTLNRFTEIDVELLTLVGNTAAVTIQNAVLFEATKSELAQREQRERELEIFATVSAALRTAASRNEMFPIILDQTSALAVTPQVSLVLCDEVTNTCVIELSRGDWTEMQGQRWPLVGNAIGIINASGQLYLCEDTRIDPSMSFMDANARSQMLVALPLMVNQKSMGVLWVGRYRDDPASHMFTDSEVRLLSAIANIAANAINRTTLYESAQKVATDLVRAYDSTLEGWAHALELRDQETEGHTRRVVKTTIDLARALGLRADELEHVRRGALLHDIGKMGIPDSVLLKPGTLNEREWEIMRRHPEYAKDLLMPIEYLRPVLDIPYCHHEKWDGSGYPRGLKAEEIPLTARIFAIVDVWDALTSDRPYRKAWSREKALDYIREQSGKHFDPQVVVAFIKMLEM